MKKVITIIIAVITITLGMTVTIHKHYCGGELAGIKLSVTGKLASCGMESAEHGCPNQSSIDRRCCDDQLTYYNISSKYLPEYFRLSHPVPGRNIPAIPVYNVVYSATHLSYFNTWSLPPGENLKSGILLSEICVFRI